MTILEATTGKIPWSDQDETRAWFHKTWWAPETDEGHPPGSPPAEIRHLVWCMCHRGPRKRVSLPSVVYELDQLILKESSSPNDLEFERLTSFDEFEGGNLNETWLKVQTHMENCNDVHFSRMFDELKTVRERLQGKSHHPTVLSRFDGLLVDFYRTIKMSPGQARMLRLSSTRATTNSLYAFQWRVRSLMKALGGTTDSMMEPKLLRQQLLNEHIELFNSGVSDVFLLLNDLKSPEERSAFLGKLKAEIENPLGSYSPEQVEELEKMHSEIASKRDGDIAPVLTPEWFIPWYELLVDEWNCLGEGGFGSVHRAKWLDSDVVVKRVILDGSNAGMDASSSLLSLSSTPHTQPQQDATKRAEAQAMFRREVDIWFGFSHPNVIRLFGACHVGRPFFVCEYATNGTLVKYLREHPDELWSKLHEAALGVQYLHARGVVHGDLKGNNIVIGSNMKAKVTDFGLSSIASVEAKPVISGAWQWVAPESLEDGSPRPTFASDVYSLGMCIVEALRVVEAARSGNNSRNCLPWRVADRVAVNYHATHGNLPSRPAMCEDGRWALVIRMCILEPEKRIKVSTVVDELARLADQASHTGDVSLAISLSWEFAPTVIEAGQVLLGELLNDTNQPGTILSLYSSFWKRLERVYKRIEESQDKLSRGDFCSLVSAAAGSTWDLQSTEGSLLSVADTTMQCYALDRALTKLCEAYFVVCENE